jgi:hypothetical protein
MVEYSTVMEEVFQQHTLPSFAAASVASADPRRSTD